MVDILEATQQGQQQYGAAVNLGVLDGMHIGATWQIKLNSPSAVAMQPSVKLFWPLVI